MKIQDLEVLITELEIKVNTITREVEELVTTIKC